MENHFVLKPDQYVGDRDLNVMRHYLEDCAIYLHKHTGKPLEECKSFVTGYLPNSNFEDPPTRQLTRNKHGDREVGIIPLSEYIKDVSVNDRIMSPTMTVYHNPDQLQSITGEFIEVNIKRRKTSKHEMFDAKQKGNESLATFKNNEQASFKISNNSLSGAHVSSSTILHCGSAHPSLTSTCRTATSYGNANNEKFLFGNRHYWSDEIVKSNIISIIKLTDYELLQKVIDVYGIRYPTPEETFDVIKYSTDLYWPARFPDNERRLQSVMTLVNTLSPIERAAFVYTGDLFHLAKYNDTLVRTFLTELSTKSDKPIDDPDTYINQMDDDLKAFINLLCSKETVGKTHEEIKTNFYSDWQIIGATAKKVLEVLDKYQWLIKCLWCSKNLPSSVAYIKGSIRRGVITSDTDSTIFTVQDWVMWYIGDIKFTEQANNISYAVVYLATQTIAHLLAMVSANMGTRERHVHKLSMKNEFAFPVFVLTTMTKHYFAYISAQEGNVYSNLDIEVKGVYLKDSNAPPYVMDEFNKSLKHVMDSVMTGNGIDINDLLKKISRIEHSVIDSIKKGNSFYLARAQVKDADSYKNQWQSPYTHFVMWESVFAFKYGSAPPTPYQAVKVSVDLDNKTKVAAWLADMTDQEVARRVKEWMRETKKTGITTFLLPKSIVEEKGIPEEIIKGMNLRKLIYATSKPFYILLESLGIYYINGSITKLISDTVSPD